MTGARFRTSSRSRVALGRRQGRGGGGHGGGGGGHGGSGHGQSDSSGGGDDDDDDDEDDSTTNTTSSTSTTAEKTTTTKATTSTETTKTVAAETTTEKTSKSTSTTKSSESTTSTKVAAAAATTSDTSTSAGSDSTAGSSTRSGDDASATSTVDGADATNTSGGEVLVTDSSTASSPTTTTSSGAATLESSTAGTSSKSGSNTGAIAGVVVALVLLGLIGFLLYRFRKRAFMQRALARLKRDRDDDPSPGPYYDIEKPAIGPARTMTGETLVSVAATRVKDPNDPRPTSWTGQDSTRYLGPNPDVATRGAPVHDAKPLPRTPADPETDSLPVSPLSQTSHDLGSEISPVSPSFNHTGALPIQEPTPVVASRAGRGKAVSIAGAEPRIVSIPPRSSRVASGGHASDAGSVPGGAAQGARTPASHRSSYGSTELSPPPLRVNRNRGKPPVSMRPIHTIPTAPPMSAPTAPYVSAGGAGNGVGNNGGYQAYHPSMGRLATNQADPRRISRDSHASVSGASVASSELFSPGSITWPMPPGTPTTPDRP